MIEARKKATSITEELVIKKLHIFIDAQLVTITGPWQWSLQTDEIFCSDVFNVMSPENISLGAKCLIHPDDVGLLHTILQSKEEEELNASFRIIASNSCVHMLHAEGLFNKQIGNGFLAFVQQKQAEDFIQSKRAREAQMQNGVLLSIYQYADEIGSRGIWYFNTVTNETYYSDNVYRIFNLPPQSLNAHLHTFHPFIYDDEKETVVNAFEEAYSKQVPLQIEYHIVVKEGFQKAICQSTNWTFNEKGQLIWFGVISDSTHQKREAANLVSLTDSLHTSREMNQLQEKNNYIVSWSINLFSRKVEYSNTIYRLFGIKNLTTLITPNTLLNYVHLDDREKYQEAQRKIFKQHIVPDLEFRITRGDGRVRYLRQKGKIIINSQDEMVLVGFTQDVTEKVISELKLKQSDHKLFIQRVLLGKIEEAEFLTHWIWNLDTGAISWSEGFYHFLGYKQGSIELTQKMLISFIYPEDRDKFTAAISATLHKGIEDNFSFRMLLKGEIKWIEATFKLVTHEEKRVFIGLLSDKTTKHQLEQQLKDGLQLAEMISNASLDRIAVIDADNYILQWNKACEETYAVKKEKAIGKNLFDLFPKSKTPEMLSHFEEAQKGERVFLKNQKSKLGLGYHDISLTPIKDEEDIVIAVLVVVHDITAEYEMQEALVDRVQFIEQLIETSVDRIIALDKNMNYVYWNQKAEEYYHLKKEEVLGKNILELFPGFVNDPTYHEFRQAVRGEMVHVPAIKNMEAKNGYFETYLIPVKSKKGEVTNILWIVHDLNKEYLLQRQQAKSSSLIDAINENFLELDDEYHIIYMNPKAEGFFGISREEVKDRSLLDVLPQVVGTPLHEAIKKAMQEGIPTRDEFVSPAKGIRVFVSISPTEEGVVIVFLEIEEMKKAQEKLAESFQFIQQICDTSPDIITVFDIENGTAMYMNNGINSLLEYSVKELNKMGHEGRMQKIIYPDDRSVFPQFNASMYSATSDEIKTIEYRVLTKTGKLKWLKNRSRVFKTDKDGKATHLICILEDITEAKQLQQEIMERKEYTESLIRSLEKQNKELESKNDEINAFAFVASHDLKEPIRKLHTFSDFLLNVNEDHAGKKGKEYLYKIKSAVKQLDVLIEDILALTKIHVHHEETVEVDLNEVLQQVKEQMHEKIANAKAELEATELPPIKGVKSYLFYLFKNLISNGIKFQHKDAVPHIKIKAEEKIVDDKACLLLSFTDNGIGFNPAYEQMIFQIFRRLHGKSEYPGTGMGLAICKKIMEKHGGYIMAKSEIDRGSVFTCYFPM